MALPKAHAGPKAIRRTAKEKRDESVMDTNNSCIVSKRCVEKLYFGEDNGFLRHFVRKFQRRSPLISRGYWLRMKAVEHAVRVFCGQESGRKKLIVNLGCGYDTIPFKFLRDDLGLCSSTTFVDVDYPILMKRKVDVLLSTEAFAPFVSNRTATTDKQILLHTGKYVACTCDLQDVNRLHTSLAGLCDLLETDILFVAEVSMTYMAAKDAENVVKWSSTLPNAQFCLLEQFLPDGPDHPFASTMLKHFQKLNSPLRSACDYPSLQDQRKRFTSQAWPSVSARTLWDLWQDDAFLTADERRSIDLIEPFDEWEEFALFASHYFVLHATHEPAPIVQADSHQEAQIKPETYELIYEPHHKQVEPRRYAAACMLDDTSILFHGGHGTRSRLRSFDVVTPSHESGHAGRIPSALGLPELMCHQILPRHTGFAIVGGRSSPSKPSKDYLLVTNSKSDDESSQWHLSRGPQMPQPVFRSVCVDVQVDTNSQATLVMGGTLNTSEIYMLLHSSAEQQWITVPTDQTEVTNRFGATGLAFVPGREDECWRSGIFTGGIGTDKKILNDLHEWRLVYENDRWRVDFTDRTKDLELGDGIQRQDIGRFGASLISIEDGFLLIGGVGLNGVIPKGKEILHISRDFHVRSVNPSLPAVRPLLVGHSATYLGNGRVLIAGGGAVCFSFGTCWNTGLYVLGKDVKPAEMWKVRAPTQSQKTKNGHNASSQQDRRPDHAARVPMEMPPLVPRIAIDSATDFEKLLEASKPAVLTGLKLGQCTELWKSNEYLKSRIPESQMVTVHDSPTRQMSFQQKNFSYRTVSFHNLLEASAQGASVYMRSISSTSPTSTATSLEQDWPSIAADFVLPPQLAYVADNAHSSPLRISGRVRMWLHYDVMANVLCMLTGPPRTLLLFSPTRIGSLGFAPGQTTSPVDPFDDAGIRAMAHEVVLQAGEVLFIPPCWPHAADPGVDIQVARAGSDSTSGPPRDGGPVAPRYMTIAVNVFFRSLSHGNYAAGKDVYANRDLAAYENGRRDVQRIKRLFKELPRDLQRFYLTRLADELLIEGAENHV